jgi:hypothetical protein
MANYEWILQPPQTDKYTFLVDEISDYATYGRTRDMDKINYNRTLMGVNFNMEVGVNTALSNAGISAVLPLGRFITIFQTSRDEQLGAMTFIDYEIGMTNDQFRTLLSSAFRTDLVDACLDLLNLLKSDFTPSDDIVRLEQVD